MQNPASECSLKAIGCPWLAYKSERLCLSCLLLRAAGTDSPTSHSVKPSSGFPALLCSSSLFVTLHLHYAMRAWAQRSHDFLHHPAINNRRLTTLQQPIISQSLSV
jgi:hypothetical protein